MFKGGVDFEKMSTGHCDRETRLVTTISNNDTHKKDMLSLARRAFRIELS